MGRIKRAHARGLAREVRKQRRKELRQMALRAGTAAVFAVSGGMLARKACAAGEADAHCLAVPGDADGDGLADWEEKVLGYDAEDADEDRSGTADGVESALRCAVIVRSLPIQQEGEPLPEGLYVTETLTFGLEQCHVCGESYNMGFITIHDPATDREESLCFLAVHYLEHGSFSFSGTVHEDRVCVPRLLRILDIEVPNQGEHQVPVPGDSDGDLLSDREEYGLGYKPFEADQNGTLTADGADLAKSLAVRVENWPLLGPGYEIHEYVLLGVEQCHICGKIFNMGGIAIANTQLGLRYPQDESKWLPNIALHSMSHGSFDYFGEIHIGRVDINLLMRVLDMQVPYPSDRHVWPLAVADTDKDGISDVEEVGARLNAFDTDQNENLDPDGVELAQQCRRVLDELPVYETPPAEPEGPYKINRFQKGLEVCEFCGESVNMGYWEVHHPALKLSMEVPDIACHAMAHGTFGYMGDVHGVGRTDVNKLLAILEMPRKCGDIGTLYRQGDVNRDCRVDLGDLAELGGQWLTDTQP